MRQAQSCCEMPDIETRVAHAELRLDGRSKAPIRPMVSIDALFPGGDCRKADAIQASAAASIVPGARRVGALCGCIRSSNPRSMVSFRMYTSENRRPNSRSITVSNFGFDQRSVSKPCNRGDPFTVLTIQARALSSSTDFRPPTLIRSIFSMPPASSMALYSLTVRTFIPTVSATLSTGQPLSSSFAA